MVNQALLLYPPGNIAAASFKSILNFWDKHTHNAFGPQMCFIFSVDLSQNDEWSREKLSISNSHLKRQKPCESCHVTIVPKMITVWINKDRNDVRLSQLNVCPPCWHFQITNLSFIAKCILFFFFLIKEVMWYILIWHYVTTSFFKWQRSSVPAIKLMNITTYFTNVSCFWGRVLPKQHITTIIH